MASRDTFTWVTGKYDYVNAPALKRLLVAGAILKPFPQDVLEACYKAAGEIYDDLTKTNPHFKKMYESLVAFRNDSLAWNQVAELSFDTFMSIRRTASLAIGASPCFTRSTNFLRPWLQQAASRIGAGFR